MSSTCGARVRFSARTPNPAPTSSIPTSCDTPFLPGPPRPCENQPRLEERVPWILKFPAKVRGVIIEPMLEDVDLGEYLLDKESVPNYVATRCSGGTDKTHTDSWWDAVGPCRTCGADRRLLDWVVVGCETGTNRRPCEIDWIRSVVDQAQNAGVPVWVKAVEVDGKEVHKLDQLPGDLRVRELPK